MSAAVATLNRLYAWKIRGVRWVEIIGVLLVAAMVFSVYVAKAAAAREGRGSPTSSARSPRTASASGCYGPRSPDWNSPAGWRRCRATPGWAPSMCTAKPRSTGWRPWRRSPSRARSW